MARCLIALGSNLGASADTLTSAVAALGNHADIELEAVSRWHTYPAVGGPLGQDDYLNGSALLSTMLDIPSLFTLIQQVEIDHNRRRRQRWAARTLDLDILLYDQIQLSDDQLSIPHPRMAFRRFVLEPAAEIAAEMVHPQIGWTIERLFSHLNRARPYMAIACRDERFRNAAAEQIASATSAHLIQMPAGGLPDRSGQPQRAPIEFLRRAVKHVSPTQREASQWAISDFSLAQLIWQMIDGGLIEGGLIEGGLIEGGLIDGGLGEGAAAIEADIKSLGADAVAPKLLLLASSHGDEHWRRGVLRQHDGPVLEVDAGQLELAVEEAVAAIKAMP